jgi:hypothetical protein
MGHINIEIPDDDHRKAKAVSALRGMTLVEYINLAIEEKLRREK